MPEIHPEAIVQRSSALGPAPAAALGAAGARIAIRALPPATRFALRLGAGLLDRHREVAGFRLDQPVNRLVASGPRSSVRLGPDEWLLLAPDGESAAISRDVARELSAAHHALVDIGHRNFAFEVAGDAAPAVLGAGCPLDLHSSRFPTGTGTRTLLAKAEIVLLRTADAPAYRIECWRSFARYVEAFLADAALEHRGRLSIAG